MKENKELFLKIKNYQELAHFFDLSYQELAYIIYNSNHKYSSFEIPKKSGGYRKIYIPNKKLKSIQFKLKEVLYSIYKPQKNVYGFVLERNIIQNAEKHLKKDFVFNIDLKDFFGSINFGRVRGLFNSKIFGFNLQVSTILAQICCLNKSLPQGAPTSPIISNFISFHLDLNLQKLAIKNNATYTRYVDDITFSFKNKLKNISPEILFFENNDLIVGKKLLSLIEKSGFEINNKKTRLYSQKTRMEVTGLIVNQFVNVRIKYIKQIFAMLYAWEKYGYELAEREHNNKYSKHSKNTKKYLHVIKGKLSFLKSVRGENAPIFKKLSTKFNKLVDNENFPDSVKFYSKLDRCINSLWIIEINYDKNGESISKQGTGFELKGIGIVTNAHVVSNNNKILKEIKIFRYDSPHKKYNLFVEKIHYHKDIAICKIKDKKNIGILTSNRSIIINDEVTLFGFPNYSLDSTYSRISSTITKTYPLSGVSYFEINTQIREGNSGGPIVDSQYNIVGIAKRGALQDEGNNECINISELYKSNNENDWEIVKN